MRASFPLAAFAMLAACGQSSFDPVPETSQPAHIADDALLVVLTYPTDMGMEALISGTLTRRGPCLYLDTGAQADLILWSDDVKAGRLDGTDWLVNDATTNQRFREGDFLQGGGGHLPETADLEALTPEEIPFECENGSAIQFHSVRKIAKPPRGDGPPDPPPPPPAPPSIIDQVKDAPPDLNFPKVTVAGMSDPREAMFAHLIGEYRSNDHHGPKTICLTDAPDALVARLDRRFGRIENDRACGWKDGGVILKASGESALFIHAKVDCSGRECAAEGGATYGNLGGEGNGYRMRRKGDGWTLQKTGLGWIS